MTQDVEHFARRLANKEAADSPPLVGQGMHDLASESLSRGMGVNIVDLDRCVWHHRRRRALPHHADLHREANGRRQGHDPPKIHHRLKRQHRGVKLSTDCWVVSLKKTAPRVGRSDAENDGRHCGSHLRQRRFPPAGRPRSVRKARLCAQASGGAWNPVWL
jgi:hypothetical protein